MENVIPGREFEGYLPLLPHDIDGKLLIYTVYKNLQADLLKYPFIMMRHIVNDNDVPIPDSKFAIKFSDLAALHNDMTGQGFRTMGRQEGADTNVIGCYL